MTTENKKANIKEELVRAQQCLKEADTLAREGLYLGAVSRLYYYLFHAVRALLLAKELEPKTHDGAERLLGLHFVKTGILDPGASHLFSRLMKYREEADPSYVFMKDDYVQFRQDAEALYLKVGDVLAREGLQ